MSSSADESIRAFLDGSPHAVVGASRERHKYGNKVLRAFLQNELPVFAVNPRASEVEGQPCYPDLRSLPEPVHGVSVITPAEVTLQVIEEAAAEGIRHVWLQPGAENAEVLERAHELGLDLIAAGPCILVVLRYRELSG